MSCLVLVLSQQLMIVEMFIVTLVTRLFYRRTYAPLVLDQHESDNTQNDKMILSSAIEENAA